MTMKKQSKQSKSALATALEQIATVPVPGKFDGVDNRGRPKKDYLTRIEQMDDVALFEECKSKIWLSAFASNNSRSDYHWHCDATYAECSRRGKTEIYSRAHAAVSKKD
jgi:hypothetical protein